MTSEQLFQLWMALIAAIPPTLMGMATLIYVIKNRMEVKAGHAELNAKVDAVKTEVDGKTTLMVEAIKEMANRVVDNASAPRPSRRTDKTEGEV